MNRQLAVINGRCPLDDDADGNADVVDSRSTLKLLSAARAEMIDLADDGEEHCAE